MEVSNETHDTGPERSMTDRSEDSQQNNLEQNNDAAIISSSSGRLNSFKFRVTAEPVMFLFMFGGSLYYPAFQSLIYFKVNIHDSLSSESLF